MFSVRQIPLTLFVLFCSIQFIAAVPTWEGMNGRSSITSLIPGASYIQAMGPAAQAGMVKHLSVHVPEKGGNLTVTPNTRTPPLFYINQDQLWLLVNETAVYPVNVHNSTGTHELPMQLILGNKREGITSGKWRWKTTMLYYDLPSGKSNDGLYFLCITESGLYNVFMTGTASPSPNGCRHLTLHSFIRSNMK
ncbi:hypothetical protein BDZ97DRAFT_35523 [Flammula alnicola]|nr:hypothetical protein BDZ97DRAFT_35523 [Flammula alnicola]